MHASQGDLDPLSWVQYNEPVPLPATFFPVVLTAAPAGGWLRLASAVGIASLSAGPL